MYCNWKRLSENIRLNAPRPVHVTLKSAQSLRETVLVKNFVNFYPPLVVHLVDANITSGSQLGVVLVKHLGLVNDLSID